MLFATQRIRTPLTVGGEVLQDEGEAGKAVHMTSLGANPVAALTEFF